MTSDDEDSLPPSASGVSPPVTTTPGNGPPGPGDAAVSAASSIPDTQAVSLPGVTQQLPVIYGSNGVSTINVV